LPHLLRLIRAEVTSGTNWSHCLDLRNNRLPSRRPGLYVEASSVLMLRADVAGERPEKLAQMPFGSEAGEKTEIVIEIPQRLTEGLEITEHCVEVGRLISAFDREDVTESVQLAVQGVEGMLLPWRPRTRAVWWSGFRVGHRPQVVQREVSGTT
jgi:hypothetical protein